MIKFKEAGNGNFIRISLDEDGEELSRTATFSEKSKPKTMGAGFFTEKLAWEEAGNVVEPQYTVEEQAAKDQSEADAEAVAWIGKRESEYPSIKDMTVALWERIVEDRPEASDAIEVERQRVKEKYPDPD